MLAGTVLSDKSPHAIQAMLSEQAIESRIIEDEIVLQGEITLSFRTSFAHEYILVGDAFDGDALQAEAKKLSSLLRLHHIQHAFEIYDIENQQIFEYEFEC